MGEEEATMREKLIEAMARALAESESGDPGFYDTRPLIDHMAFKRDAAAALDAALDVLETPSEEMVTAGIIERHDAGVPDAWSLATANIFRAMLATPRSRKI